MEISFNNYLKKNWKLIVFLAVFTFVFCFMRLCFHTISYDTDEWLYTPNVTLSHWLGIGRFSLVLLKVICGTGTSLEMLNIVTYINVFIYTVLFIYFLNLNRESTSFLRNFLCGAILITSPIFLEQYYFTLQSAEVSFAMILMVVIYILTYHQLAEDLSITMRVILTIVIFIALVFSIGVYQSFANLYIIGVIICLYKRNDEDKKQNLKSLFLCVAMFILSLVTYFVISDYVIKYFHIQSSDYLCVEWLQDPKGTFLILIRCIAKVMIGRGNVLNLSFSFCTVYVLYRIVKERMKVNWEHFYLIALLISPFFLNLLTGNGIVLRSVLGFPIVCSFLFFEYFEEKRWFRCCLYITVLSQIVHSELLIYSDYCRNENDIEISKTIYRDCNSDKDAAIVLCGVKNSTCMLGETIGRSFFEWTTPSELSNVADFRAEYFMHLNGFDYKTPTPEQTRVRDRLIFQASYPDDGYIQKVDGVYYVNLGINQYLGNNG